MSIPTGGTNRYMYLAPSQFKEYAIDTSKMTTEIKAGDAVWYDRANKIVLSAADFPWQGSIADTQRAFAAQYAGVSQDFIPIAANPVGTFLPNMKCRVAIEGCARFPIASATWAEEALVSLAQDATPANKLDPKNAIVVTDPSLAFGKAMVNSNGGITALVSGSNSSGVSGTIAATSILFQYAARIDDPTLHVGRDGFIQDPGTGVAIPLPQVGKFALGANIGAGAETNTLAAGKSGQEFFFTHGTIGVGSREITFPAAISGANTKCKITAAGQFAIFKCAGNGAWGLVANFGTTLS